MQFKTAGSCCVGGWVCAFTALGLDCRAELSSIVATVADSGDRPRNHVLIEAVPHFGRAAPDLGRPARLQPLHLTLFTPLYLDTPTSSPPSHAVRPPPRPHAHTCCQRRGQLQGRGLHRCTCFVWHKHQHYALITPVNSASDPTGGYKICIILKRI